MEVCGGGEGVIQELAAEKDGWGGHTADESQQKTSDSEDEEDETGDIHEVSALDFIAEGHKESTNKHNGRKTNSGTIEGLNACSHFLLP